MTVSEIRQKYLDFFRAQGHSIVPSASLVPENDPTTLFVSSGMQPLVPYFLGTPHPMGKRIANSQKSLRTQDIETVGDNRHTTFFEMLGNWSFGDPDAADGIGAGYFKEDQLQWVWEFLTSVIRLPADRLWITCFEGDRKLGIPKDTESAEIWKRVGVPEERVRFYGAERNWWSRAGTPTEMPPGEPGGPDSEVFYDFRTPHDPRYGAECHPNCECGRFLEIGNSVFMEYVKREDGSFGKLPARNVDFGGGLERIVAAANDDSDIFHVDVFDAGRETLQRVYGKKYGEDAEFTRACRIILDHTRAALFMMADGVLPSNTERGYVLRRLLRRSIFFASKLENAQSGFAALGGIISGLINVYKTQYPEVVQEQEFEKIITEEESKFRVTLALGMRELKRIFEGRSKDKFGNFSPTIKISGAEATTLATTYGFPIELMEEIAKERGVSVDIEEYKKEMQKHKSVSRAGATQKFAGGLADHSEATIRYHTAHHLLLAALRKVLGLEVHQRGSNITGERLRIDFAFPRKMTQEEIAQAEALVNEKIVEELPVTRSVIPREEAEKLGAEHEFGVKYPETVSVYSVGPKGATAKNPRFSEAFSLEFCGGPHVSNTAEIAKAGYLRIIKEEAVAAGIRRIKAVLE